MSDSTAVQLGGTGFKDLGIVVAITGTVAVGLFVIQVITSVLHRDPGGLARAANGLRRTSTVLKVGLDHRGHGWGR